MVVALVVLVVLISLAPAYGIIGSNTATGLVCAVAAFALAALAGTLDIGAVRKLRLFSPALLIILLAPLAWMLLQVEPLPLAWFSDPVWASTSAALNLPMAGSISVDAGATLLSFLRYCAVLATAFITAAITLDRQSASRMLHLLTAVAALIALAQLARELSYFWFWHPAGGDVGAALIAAIGIIASCSLLIRLHRKLSRERKRAAPPKRATIFALAGGAVALVLCVLSILVPEDMSVLFAALFGAGVPISIFAIRKWSLGIWGKLGVLATASIILAGFLAVTPIKMDVDPTLALSQNDSPSAELMLSDVPLLGRGAGSVGDILPAYRDLNDRSSHRSMTAAALITVEMGRAFLWLFVLALIIGAALLIRASLRRSRDSVYAASGGGILLAILLVTFINSNLLTLPASLLASAALGLAWAQSRSDTNDASSAAEISAPAMPISEQPHLYRSPVKLACAFFGLVLMAGACWILIPELYLPGALPEKSGAVTSLEESESLNKAASLALVRGDLWTKSALASAALLDSNPGLNSTNDQVRERLVNALTSAPYQADVWLTLARLANQFKWTRYDTAALLKMVYYTGSNDVDLVAARTKLALRLNATTVDAELQDLVKRDVNLILQRWPELRPALVEAYRSANPEGKALAEGVIARNDPAFLSALRRQ
jgi:hypothetical protein